MFGWYMWDRDAADGFDNGFVVFGATNPVKPEKEQAALGGDHIGHIWKSRPVYFKEDTV